MLVLGRRKRQNVVIGDEITLTVEEICDSGDSRQIPGASVRFGFETPRYVSICRGELRARQSGAVRAGGAAWRAPPRPFKLVGLPDAQVRLRIQVPRKVPVCHNGTPVVGLDSEAELSGQVHRLKSTHHVTCHQDDRITICNNITITPLDFRRCVPVEDREPVSQTDPPERHAYANLA